MNRWVALAPAYPPLSGEPLQRGAAADHDHPAAGAQRPEQSLAQPVERDPDVGLPVDRERLPGLVLQRPHERGGAGHQDDDRRVVAVEQAAGDRWVTGVGDLGLDRRPCRLSSPSALAVRATAMTGAPACGERGGDPAAEAAARADDDSRLVRWSFVDVIRSPLRVCQGRFVARVERGAGHRGQPLCLVDEASALPSLAALTAHDREDRRAARAARSLRAPRTRRWKPPVSAAGRRCPACSQRLRVAGGDAGGDRDPDRAARAAGRCSAARTQARRWSLVDARERGDRDRDERERGAGAGDEERAGEVRQEVPVDGDLGGPDDPRRRSASSRSPSRAWRPPRVTSHCERPASAIEVSDAASHATPVCSAL